MDNTADFAMGYTMGDRNNGYGNGWGGGFGGEGLWLFAILALMGGGFGNFGIGNRGVDGLVTESALCNANSFNELKSAVGRGFDQQSQFAFQNQRDLCQSTATLSAQMERNAAAIAAQTAQCCCDTKQLLMENRYLAERNAANSDAVTVAQTQKILDAICGNRIADMQARINQLELQSQLGGVVRYPTSTTFATTCNPFFGSWGNGFGCNNGCCGCNG